LLKEIVPIKDLRDQDYFRYNMSNAPPQNGARLDQQDAGLGVEKDRSSSKGGNSRYLPPHLRGKPGSGDDRPPPEPRRDDFDRGGRSGNFYYILKYVAMWRKFVLVSQKRYMRQ